MSRKLRGKGRHEDGAGEEEIDEKPKSLLMNLISQLKVGMDLSKVTLPTFILEPRSFLEKLTDFMLHAHLILPVARLDSEEERFLGVLRWYLSGWHLKPKGCKKPYNPILGETFHAHWPCDSEGDTAFIAEQVSHHPPISAFHIANNSAGVVLDGVVFPRSKFLGNSAASILDGKATLHFTGQDERYVFGFPSYYVKGVIFGKLSMEIGDKTTIVCEETGWSAEVEFKTKGMLFGRDNENMVVATVKRGKEKMYTVSGYWDDVLDISRAADGKKAKPEEFLDVTVQSKLPLVAPEPEKQGEFESRKLWEKVTEALIKDDQDAATAEKTRLEDNQRAEAKARKESGEQWVPKYFALADPNDKESWTFKGMKLENPGEGPKGEISLRERIDGKE